MDQITLWTIVGVALVIMGFFASAVYWAGQIQSKMDQCISLLSEIPTQIDSLDRRVTRLEDKENIDK